MFSNGFRQSLRLLRVSFPDHQYSLLDFWVNSSKAIVKVSLLVAKSLQASLEKP